MFPEAGLLREGTSEAEIQTDVKLPTIKILSSSEISAAALI
jgi:hypothetical protein